MTTPVEAEEHLVLQHNAWSAALYSQGRAEPDAQLDVCHGDGTSGYDFTKDVIVIFIPEGNLSDFDSRR